MDQHDASTLQQLDAAHHLHPFNDNAALALKGTRILTRGEGAYVWDAHGNKLLDAFAGLWCVNIGYGRKELGVEQQEDPRGAGERERQPEHGVEKICREDDHQR